MPRGKRLLSILAPIKMDRYCNFNSWTNTIVIMIMMFLMLHKSVIIGNFITEELIFGNRLSSTKIMMISDLLLNKEPTKFPSKSDALKRLGGQLYGLI